MAKLLHPPEMSRTLREIFCFRIFLTKCIHTNAEHSLSFARFIAEIPSCVYYLIHYFQAFNYLAESGVIAIQMRGGGHHDEKLGTSGIGISGPSHRKNASFVGEMVGKGITLELSFNTVTWAPCSAAQGTSALNHETGNNPVKDQTIIKPLFYQ